MSNYSDLLIFAVVFALWFVLNRWLLPWFGISTCMSGGCAMNPRATIRQQDVAAADRQQPSRPETDAIGLLNGESRASQDGNQR